MIRVVKEYKFDAAHRLTNYIGPCSNIHGHSYKVQICFERGMDMEVGVRSCSRLNEQCMVVDFKDIKGIIGDWIMQNFDHALILDRNDTILRNFFESGICQKMYYMEGSPTAERMAVQILKVAEAETFESSLRPIWVKVWETETSYAFVEGDYAH